MYLLHQLLRFFHEFLNGITTIMIDSWQATTLHSLRTSTTKRYEIIKIIGQTASKALWKNTIFVVFHAVKLCFLEL